MEWNCLDCFQCYAYTAYNAYMACTAFTAYKEAICLHILLICSEQFKNIAHKERY